MPTPAGSSLFLIDGYALIYRAFFAMMGRPLRTSRGENTSAVFGVTQFLLRLAERYHPTHVGWVHDAGTSYRHEQYPEYKATREKLDEELQQDFQRSLERVEALLVALRIPLIVVEGFEADDVIGTLATQAAQRGIPTVIVSGDKDLYQLVGPRISVLNPGRGGRAAIEEQLVDVSNADQRFGVPPERVIDYLALVGDSSDNVPGVRGIGDKTARQLIAQYGSLEDVLAHAAAVPQKRAREALLAGAENARLSRQLVTIRRDVPITLELERLRVREKDSAALRRLFGELEFHELIQRLDLAERPVAAAVSCDVVDAPEQVPSVVAGLRGVGPVIVAAQLAGADPLTAPMVGLALGAAEGEAGPWYFPYGHRIPGELQLEPAKAGLPDLTDPVMRPLVDLLHDPAVPKVGHDLKREWLALRRGGVELAGGSCDTMLASFVLDPGRRSHALDVLAAERLELELRGEASKEKTPRDLAEWSPPAVARLAGGELEAIRRLRREFGVELERLGLVGLLREIEMPLVPVLVDMEWRGIAVDVERLQALSREFGEELTRIERAIYLEAGVEFNLNSTPQLRHVLFEKLQLPVIKKTKTGPSTDADVLEQLAAMRFTVPALLLEYRELSKLKSTYVDVLPSKIHPVTGRIHTSFNQTGAATGRLSSSEPNLQNIPVRTARGEEIRRCFVPATGCVLVVADYSQVELRLLAHLSQDAAFIEAFRRGGDIHRETAAIIFGVPVPEVSSEMRARAKTINFATIYGQGPFALSRQLGITLDDAKQFIRLYFERFAGVRRFLDDSIERARRLGYAETLFGRRRYIAELHDPNYNVRAFGERTAMNSPLQGSAADLIKRAMIGLHRALTAHAKDAGMVLQVHDELVVECPARDAEQVALLVRREMETAASLSVPLVVDVGIGLNWLDAKR